MARNQPEKKPEAYKYREAKSDLMLSADPVRLQCSNSSIALEVIVYVRRKNATVYLI